MKNLTKNQNAVKEGKFDLFKGLLTIFPNEAFSLRLKLQNLSQCSPEFC